MTPQAVLLTGAIATGKTAVAQEVVAAAAEVGMTAAAIDLDWLGWAVGPGVDLDHLVPRNLAAVAANYAAANIRRLVLARAILAPTTLEAVITALPGWTVTVIHLHAGRATLEERIRRRDSGTELREHLAEIDVSAVHARSAVPDAPTVINEGRPLRDVATEVMRIAGWT